MGDLYRQEKNKTYIFYSDRTSFLSDLPDFDQEAFMENCYLRYPPKKVKVRKKSELELTIRNNDQKERKKSLWDKNIQNHLDSLNRLILDSLYQKHGSLKPFNKYEQDAFSYVIHHSVDCEWTYKWFEIMLDEKKKGNLIGGKLLNLAFKRMLDKEDGYCCELDPKKCSEFIDLLNRKF